MEGTSMNMSAVAFRKLQNSPVVSTPTTLNPAPLPISSPLKAPPAILSIEEALPLPLPAPKVSEAISVDMVVEDSRLLGTEDGTDGGREEEDDIVMNNLIPIASTSNISANGDASISRIISDGSIDPSLLLNSPGNTQTESQLELESQQEVRNATPLFAPSVGSDIEVDDLEEDIPVLNSSSGEVEEDEDEEESEEDEDGPVASTSKSTPVRQKGQRRVSEVTSSQRKNSSGFAGMPLPHYTVKRSHPNNKTHPHIISVNPGVTDAIQSRWPSPLKKNAGKPDWYEEMGQDAGRVQNWLNGLGKELASRLGEAKAGSNDFWAFEDFPDNNKFVVHHSGPKPDGHDRLDAYLFGSTAAAKFRTVNEYAPHLYWLLTTGPGADSALCQCKYCAKTTQGQVNKVLGLESKREGSSTPSESSRKKRRVSNVEKKPTAPVASTSKTKPRVSEPKPLPVKPQAPSYNGAHSDPKRELDLHEGGLHREGEMVWIVLPSPLIDTSGNRSEVITHWPAIISERKIKTSSKRIGKLEPGQAPTIQNQKSYSYVVKLLACSDEYTLDESSVLTWLSHPQPTDLWSDTSLITASKSVELVWDGKDCLRPKFGEKRDVFEAMAPYALAMQIAAHIVSSFCLVDRCALKPSHIEKPSDLTESEEKEAKAHLNYSHYQSLWNGAERIYSGELVRLLASPDELPPACLSLSPGATSRSFFILIEALYKNSDKSMAMVGGTVYELKDIASDTIIEGGLSTIETNDVASTSSAVKEGKKPETKASSSTSSLPDPPPGFIFRKVMTKGLQIHYGIESIAGRYHKLPTEFFLDSPSRIQELLEEEERRVMKLGDEDTADESHSSEVRALILAGLLPASKLFMKAYSWSANRTTAVTYAEQTAQKEMSSFFETQKQEA